MGCNEGILIIGAGGVGRVVAHKCAMNIDVFGNITLVSRTKSKCELIANEIFHKYNVVINTQFIDADNIEQLTKFLEQLKPRLVINVALPYQDLTIMDACVKTNVHYIDTANYENPNEAKFEYAQQWAKNKEFKNRNLLALLGCGFDPGVTGVFCAYAQKHLFDEIHYIDIMDCNDGNNDHAFATNFNPEINLREVSANGRYWEEGRWIETKPLEIKIDHKYPKIGIRSSYLLYHEELESLSKNIKGIKRIRFFMTFSDSYILHMNCLKNVGMLGIHNVKHKDQDIVPLEFLSTLLPDPAMLGEKTVGKTNIGCVIEGIKNGKNKKYYIYQICNHQEAYKEVKSQCVSYTTGVPAFIGAKLLYEEVWTSKGVMNVEQFDPDPFMNEMIIHGLPWEIEEVQ